MDSWVWMRSYIEMGLNWYSALDDQGFFGKTGLTAEYEDSGG